MATWIKCTNTKHEAVYINLDNAVTVTRDDVADRIAERGTVPCWENTGFMLSLASSRSRP